MVSGPSVVLNRHLETNVLSLQHNKYEDARTCKTIIRYDANSLYLPCAEQEMSIGEEYKYEDARTCKTIIRYDANSLYLPCAEQEMSIGEEYYKAFIDLFDLFD